MINTLDAFKADFAKGERIHLNNAGIAPMSLSASKALNFCGERMTRGGAELKSLFDDYQNARKTFASLVGASAENTVHVQTCAIAISTVALGMPMGAGEEIVTLDQEYPSNAYAWHRAADRAGARVVIVSSDDDLRIDTQKLIDAITPRTRVVAISWVQYQSGEGVELKAISKACKAAGAWLVVDAVQGIGIIPFDLEEMGVDAVCVGTHKWLTGPMGHGFLAFRNESIRDAVEPIYYGALSYGTPDEMTDAKRSLRSDPRRFEPGNPLLLGALSGAASASVISQVGVDVIGNEARRLSKKLRRGLGDMGFLVLGDAAQKSPNVTFRAREQDAISKLLDDNNVAHASRKSGLRLAPHAFNTDGEIEKVLNLIELSGLRN